MSFEMYTAFRGKVIIKDEYKELVELINTGSWEELNKPDLNTVQTSVFKSDDISYIDLSTPPVVFIEKIIKKFYDFGTIMKERLFADRLNEPNEVISYLIIWPLMAACSIHVKNTTDTFKPEYIIPQLLL
ncbi:hypothetical protein [Bacillus cereus group sp. BfR-BA-01352]|uniref:hypothetical protein n=1 Tax=Bacillus cereus group sp. BfR-BA-01352 TaxID=2920315 RepID=UPI001F595B52|nr:hypothetical protein [Bacillus cereus group sp. BfR-BA-01352]